MAEIIPTEKILQISNVLPQVALRGLTSQDGLGVYASSDTLYRGAVFGRDSLEVCEDLMPYRRLLVSQSLRTLASLQGERIDDLSEEEPGKIVHEYRRNIVDGKQVTGRQREILRDLAGKWGGDEHELIYYGSIDATPHFIRAVGEYCATYPTYAKRFMNAPVSLRSGEQITIQQVIHRATNWLLGSLATSRSGFLEYQRRNPQGIENQVWKDSAEFYVHRNGEYANHDMPIASIEVQGLVFDALHTAAEILDDRQAELHQVATALRERILRKLWLTDEAYFALGTDYADSGRQRLIRTRTANPAALLDTRLFNDLPESERKKYVQGIIRRIMSDDFLTDAGIRSRALSEGQLIPFNDYHGSFVTWPKETYDIAKGLRRQGFPRLARQLENRLLNVCLRNLAYPEFIYVDRTGKVLPLRPTEQVHAGVMLVEGPNEPERIQAWTVSAILSIMMQRPKDRAKQANVMRLLRYVRRGAPSEWQSGFEKDIMREIPYVKRLVTPKALQTKYPRYDYVLQKPE